MFWGFSVWINCSSDLKKFANSLPSASNLKKKISITRTFFFSQEVRTILETKYQNSAEILKRKSIRNILALCQILLVGPCCIFEFWSQKIEVLVDFPILTTWCFEKSNGWTFEKENFHLDETTLLKWKRCYWLYLIQVNVNEVISGGLMVTIFLTKKMHNDWAYFT